MAFVSSGVLQGLKSAAEEKQAAEAVALAAHIPPKRGGHHGGNVVFMIGNGMGFLQIISGTVSPSILPVDCRGIVCSCVQTTPEAGIRARRVAFTDPCRCTKSRGRFTSGWANPSPSAGARTPISPASVLKVPFITLIRGKGFHCDDCATLIDEQGNPSLSRGQLLTPHRAVEFRPRAQRSHHAVDRHGADLDEQ